MDTDFSTLITEQRQRLDEMRTDAPDIAAIITEEILDRFESVVEEFTENCVDFDLTRATLCMSLSMTLLEAYDQAFERHILSRCESVRAPLVQALGREAVDIAHIDLTGLRKGLKLRRTAQALIDQALENTKPRVGRVFGLAVCNLFRDPIQELDAVMKAIQEDGYRLREELLSLREPLRAVLSAGSLSAIRSVRLEMARQLERWPDRVPVPSPGHA